MTTIQGNLLPDWVRLQRRLRTRRRKWAGICATLAAVLLVGEVVLYLAVPGPDEVERERLVSLQDRAKALQTTLDQQSSVLAEVRRRARITERITTRPDWSILLAAVSAHRTEHVLLTSCEIQEKEDGKGIRLLLTGLGLSQIEVQQYVLALEATGLFDQITLVETRRTLSPDGERLAFSVDAQITASQWSGQQATASLPGEPR